MKKFLITIIFLCVCCFAKSQDITYTPFFRDAPRQNRQQYQPQQQTQRLRTTAYHVDNNGNYVKIPIQVTVTNYVYPTGYTSQEVKVTSCYQDTGFGGQWENCVYGAPVQQCQSFSGDEMEQSFMFKANLPMIIGWAYFDL